MSTDVIAWLLDQSVAVVLLSLALLYGHRQHRQALAAADRRCQRRRQEERAHVQALVEQVIAGSEQRIADLHTALERLEARLEDGRDAAREREARLVRLLETWGPAHPSDRNR